MIYTQKNFSAEFDAILFFRVLDIMRHIHTEDRYQMIFSYMRHAYDLWLCLKEGLITSCKL